MAESLSDIAASRSSTPSPSRADVRIAPGFSSSMRCRSSTDNKSALLNTFMMRCESASGSMPNSVNIWRTSAASSSRKTEAPSWTCNKRSASTTSSNVDLKASTSSVGSCVMNPTVSASTTSIPEGSVIARKVGSNVAKSISFAKTLAEVK